ncbi:Plant self-incompatibility S1, partial [Arabidopsis suecica]
MNRVPFLLFVFAFGLTMMSNTALSDSYTESVWIRNKLSDKNDLIVHCKSIDQDMGYHRVHPSGFYHLLYKEHDYDYFWCHLWQGPNFKHHQVFDVDDRNV